MQTNMQRLRVKFGQKQNTITARHYRRQISVQALVDKYFKQTLEQVSSVVSCRNRPSTKLKRKNMLKLRNKMKRSWRRKWEKTRSVRRISTYQSGWTLNLLELGNSFSLKALLQEPGFNDKAFFAETGPVTITDFDLYKRRTGVPLVKFQLNPIQNMFHTYL